MNKHIFVNEKFVGYISKVTPNYSNIHFPTPTLLKKFWHYEDELSGGIVGNYVVIEGENFGFLGKLIDYILVKKHLTKLILKRNKFLKELSENHQHQPPQNRDTF